MYILAATHILPSSINVICVRMYDCMHVCMYVLLFLGVSCICANCHVHVLRIYQRRVCMHASLYVCMYDQYAGVYVLRVGIYHINMHACMYICVCFCACMYARMYIRIYICGMSTCCWSINAMSAARSCCALAVTASRPRL